MRFEDFRHPGVSIVVEEDGSEERFFGFYRNRNPFLANNVQGRPFPFGSGRLTGWEQIPILDPSLSQSLTRLVSGPQSVAALGALLFVKRIRCRSIRLRLGCRSNPPT